MPFSSKNYKFARATAALQGFHSRVSRASQPLVEQEKNKIARMKSYNIKAHLESIYNTFPEYQKRPLIGITGDVQGDDVQLRNPYCQQVLAAGGVPLIIPPMEDRRAIVNILETIDGIIFSGGGDFNPLWSGEEPSPALGHINSKRDRFELLVALLARNRQLPTLGICRGMQAIAIASGGKVTQDIEESRKLAAKSLLSDGEMLRLIKHRQDADRTECSHSIEVDPESILYDIYQTKKMLVNSFHHQCVSYIGPKLKICAKAPDGVIEALESADFKPFLAVQWHPEWLEEAGLKLFSWLVKQATEFSKARDLHARIITLDSHCDTPMFFHQDIDIAKRSNEVLVDLHKMEESRQDVSTMVAYLPQALGNEAFKDKNAFGIESPKAYADFIFDRIESMVAPHHDSVSIARTPFDVMQNKFEHRRSIMLAIENGLALENDIANVEHFARRGIVYITLCHNGDNLICDSARGSETHGGVSAFGRKVISEMNRHGVMIDLSHAAESTFYDALSLSKVPVVCSHSNARALCDVPRNLTDEQLRALADKGGVAHITLYKGFLTKNGNATIDDAMAHLNHFIDQTGVDCVGLGTDFDGDGGIPGLRDSSELIRFTIYLLRKRYSDADIRKIWGGNWLRVMEQVQRYGKQL